MKNPQLNFKYLLIYILQTQIVKKSASLTNRKSLPLFDPGQKFDGEDSLPLQLNCLNKFVLFRSVIPETRVNL